jgi:spermidine synthase
LLRPQVVERAQSEHNPLLEVAWVNGQLELNTPNANYSFGNLHHVFADTFKEFGVRNRKPMQVLLLGLGAGSVVNILHSYGYTPRITGVEVDTEVVRLARQHFGLAEYPQLEVMLADATEFVQEDHLQYDLIAVDLFLDNIVPAAAETPLFLGALRSRLAPGGLLVFNRMVDTEAATQHVAHFEELFALFFPAYRTFRILDNRVFVFDNLGQSSIPG